MARKIDTDAEIDRIRLQQQFSHPSAPSSGYEYLYIISGSAHGGMFVEDSGGRQIGPFITGATPIMEQVWNYIAANNTLPIDTLITSGNYKLFIYFDTHNAASWKAATNASYAVPAGKKLIVLQSFAAMLLQSDTSSRKARFFNSTDSFEVIGPTYFYANGFPWVEASPTKMREVATGKTVRMEIWNTDTNERASGGVVVAYEATA